MQNELKETKVIKGSIEANELIKALENRRYYILKKLNDMIGSDERKDLNNRLVAIDKMLKVFQ